MPTDQRNIEIIEIMRILGTIEGRKYMMGVLNSTGLDRATFDKDTHQHAYNAGKRSVGLRLRDNLQDAAPELYLRMLQEHIEDG